MSGGPTLSAVARRRAKIEAITATSEWLQQTNDSTGILTDTTSPAAGASLPLKRKTSAPSLRQNGIYGDRSTGPQTRRKFKAARLAPVTAAAEEPVPVDYPLERPYSPSQPLNISSDEEDDTPMIPRTSALSYNSSQVAESVPPIHPPKIIPILVEGKNYFNLTPDDAYSITGERMSTKIVLLNERESLLFVGTMKLTLLQGSIRLLGTTLTPSRASHRIFAPRSHPIPVVDALDRPTESSQQRSRLASGLPGHIINSVSPSHVVLALQELVTGVEKLGRVAQAFAGMFEPDTRERDTTEQILDSAHIYRNESQYDTIFHLPDDWQKAITSILSTNSDQEPGTGSISLHDAPVILVKGSKNSGKSTFARSLTSCLTNRYQKVAFIECDLGQSEFTPGGMVSLNILRSPIFGPPFTHLSRPKYAHFVGGNSPKTSPSHYLAALGDLFQRYQLELKYSGTSSNEAMDNDEGGNEPTKKSDSVPLVINTQGWVKGMGADLLRSIEELFAPTHIVEFQLPYASSSLEPSYGRSALFSEELGQDLSNNWGRLIKLVPISPSSRSPRFSSADLRNLALASYFYGRSNNKDSDNDLDCWLTHWDTSLFLRSAAPISIDIHSALESIAIVAPTGDDVVPDDLPRAIVCGIVGLVAPDSPSTPPETPYVQGGLPPSPQNSRCIGLGFVRGASATHLHLLTPVPASQLRLCRILILGELTMPVWAFLESEDGIAEENGLPFLQWGRSIAEDAGGERRRIRRNIMRRGQI